MPSIAVMNAKGGVGKSTLTMAIAETLSLFHKKTVLIVDADGQMSLSIMAMPVDRLQQLQDDGKTIVDWIRSCVYEPSDHDWKRFGVGGVSDVDDVDGLYLIPGSMALTTVERRIDAEGLNPRLSAAARHLLDEADQYVDYVLVDCAPGISAATECFLGECDWHLVPTKPDLLAVAGIEYLKFFREQYSGKRLARHLGVLVNMFQALGESDTLVYNNLKSREEMACFSAPVPLTPHLQKSAIYFNDGRSYASKYPGKTGEAIAQVVEELIARTAETRELLTKSA